MNQRLARYPRIQHAILGQLKRIKPPPYRQDNMEILTGSWLGASSASCTEGRQFGENHTSPFYYMERRYETSVSKLGGSRAGCPINASALRSVLKNWTDAIEIIDFLRTKYVARYRLTGQPLSYVDLYVFAAVCISVPAYLLRRRENPVPSGRIPAAVGSVYKLVAGLAKIVAHMIKHAEPWMPEGETPSAPRLYTYAEAERLFLSGDGEACGGPEKMVIELMEIAIHGRPASADRGPSQQEFFSLVPDAEIDALLDYGIRCASLELSLMLFRQQAAQAALQACAGRYGTGTIDPLAGEGLLSVLEVKSDGSRPNQADVERRIKILAHALERLGAGGLVEPPSIIPPGGATLAAVHGSAALARFSPACRDHLAAFLERYRGMLHRAGDCLHAHQQEINRILGREATAPVAARKLSNRISEKMHDLLESEWGLRLRDAGPGGCEFVALN
ncbi:MAG: hypothetical protein OEY27_06965 [Gammaproteobacteria bacterium]|nr:hypothetical protein [Gammaproteobacteria bacterium]